MKYKTILLFGAPGSGKGTQGKILGTIPSFFHCACGDVFRSLRATNPLAKQFIAYTSRGQLVPDEPTVKLWRQFIQQESAGRFHPHADTLVLDGIPRNLRQAEMLADTLDVKAVFYLHCNNSDSLVQRLQRRALKENRLDDANLDVIRHRLDVYDQETKPVLKFYGPNVMHRINSDQPPTQVLGELLRHLNKVKN